jgi:peptidoglycan/LPS O-acetylase OafA/YrhL
MMLCRLLAGDLLRKLGGTKESPNAKKDDHLVEAPARPSLARPAGASEEFRPDIEGLRAVAVLLVLAYHARLPGFRGGYVGVDVFFVISGFLITGLILRELERTGTVSLPAFYARRARRLLPAAACALVVTVLLSALVLPPLTVRDVAGDGIAAALYSANIRFALQSTDYLKADLAPSPLLHYWSLGVEEQFYLFWPALLLLVGRGRSKLTRSIAIAVVVSGTASLALAIVLTGASAPWAFYSLPSRAWELALGAIVVVGSPALVPGARLALVAGCLGLAVVCLSAVVFDPRTPFPGTAALMPTIGTALVLVAGLRRPQSGAARLLAVPPLRFLGRISYSLYLWHWPALLLPAAALGRGLPLRMRFALALLLIPVAAVSQRWIEEPIRQGRLTALRPSRTLALAGAISLVAAGLSVASGIVGSTRLRGPIPLDLVPSLATVRDDLPRIYKDGCHASYTDMRSKPCIYGDLTSATTVVLFGDSHAAQWFPALERLALQHRWRLLSLTKSSCSAAEATVWNSELNRVYTECDTWRTDALARIDAAHPRLVVISHSRGHVFALDGQPVASERREDLWQQALDRTIKRVSTAAGAVVVIGDTPRLATEGPVCLSSHLSDAFACANPLTRATNPTRTAGERRIAEADGATFIDPTPWLCRSEMCPAVVGRMLVYRDAHHLTATYARALAPYLAAHLPFVP